MTTLADALRIVECRPGEQPRRLASGERPADDAVRWIDVDLRALDGRDPAGAAGELRTVLGDLCPDVDEEMLEDLLDADLWPKRQRYGHIRAVSAVSVHAADPPEGEHDTRAGTLTFQVVEMLSAEGWLVTCWHAPRTFRGSEREPETGELQGHDDVAAEIEAEWANSSARASGDLGLIVLEQLVDTYNDVRNALSDWLESWELDLYRRVETDSQPDRRTLIELRAHVFQFRKSIATLNAPSGKAKTYWFSDVSDESEAERIDDLDPARAYADRRRLRREHQVPRPERGVGHGDDAVPDGGRRPGDVLRAALPAPPRGGTARGRGPRRGGAAGRNLSRALSGGLTAGGELGALRA